MTGILGLEKGFILADEKDQHLSYGLLKLMSVEAAQGSGHVLSPLHMAVAHIGLSHSIVRTDALVHKQCKFACGDIITQDHAYATRFRVAQSALSAILCLIRKEGVAEADTKREMSDVAHSLQLTEHAEEHFSPQTEALYPGAVGRVHLSCIGGLCKAALTYVAIGPSVMPGYTLDTPGSPETSAVRDLYKKHTIVLLSVYNLITRWPSNVDFQRMTTLRDTVARKVMRKHLLCAGSYFSLAGKHVAAAWCFHHAGGVDAMKTAALEYVRQAEGKEYRVNFAHRPPEYTLSFLGIDTCAPVLKHTALTEDMFPRFALRQETTRATASNGHKVPYT